MPDIAPSTDDLLEFAANDIEFYTDSMNAARATKVIGNAAISWTILANRAAKKYASIKFKDDTVFNDTVILNLALALSGYWSRRSQLS